MAVSKNTIKSRPAGKDDKIEINVVSLEQILENNRDKALDTNSTRMEGILSTELQEGMTIKAFDGRKQEEATR